ncbi:hypothetical protein ACWGQ4_19820, partial [Streptomyces sp. NPDC055721]
GAGASGGSGAATGGALDPDTGQPVGAGDAGGTGGTGGGVGGAAGGGGELYGVPVTTAASVGGGVQTTLMVIGALMLCGITVGPPLLHRRLAARRAGEDTR